MLRKTDKKYVVDDKWKKSTVIVPIEKYEELIGDIHDLAVVAERREEETVSFYELKKESKKSGFYEKSGRN